MRNFFRRSKDLEIQISEYLDLVNKSVIIFQQCVSNYIKKEFELFDNYFKDILDIENEADDKQKEIKYKIYEYMLIPESRADVLEIVENIDNIVDLTKEVLTDLSIEEPEIPKEIEEDFLELTKMSVKTVEELIKSTRAYFEEVSMVGNYVNRVDIYEHEVDKIQIMIKRKIFKGDIVDDFIKKLHLRHFANKISSLSDESEAISERLTIAAYKRKM